MDFGDRIKYLREYNGYDQMYVCDRLKIEQSALSNYENNRRTPKFDLVNKFAELYNVSIDYLLGREEKQDKTVYVTPDKKGVSIPVLGHVQAGIPIETITNVLDYEDISSEMAAGGEYFGLREKGDSMMPVLQEGDTIIVRQQPTVKNGETAIISYLSLI